LATGMANISRNRKILQNGKKTNETTFWDL